MFRNRMTPTYFNKKVIQTLLGFLSQGLSAHKLALSFAFGITLGALPMLGVTTILCILAALIFKLNMPVIQFANYLAFPIKLLMLVPHYYIGNMVFNAQLPIDYDMLATMLTRSTPQEMLLQFVDSTLYAVGAWLLLSPLILALTYTGLKPILVRLNSEPARFKFFRQQS